MEENNITMNNIPATQAINANNDYSSIPSAQNVGNSIPQVQPVYNNAQQTQPVYSNAQQVQPVYNNAQQTQPVYSNAQQVQPVYNNAQQTQPVYNNAQQVQPVYNNAQQTQPVLNEVKPQQGVNTVQQGYNYNGAPAQQGYTQVQQKKQMSTGAIVAIVICSVLAGLLLLIGPIVAAVVIPVVTTTTNSSKLSVLESDTATMNMLYKEAVNNYKAKIDYVTYNGKKVDEATIGDVLDENNIDYNSKFFERTIGGVTYYMVLTDSNRIEVGSDSSYGETGKKISPSMKISDLAEMYD